MLLSNWGDFDRTFAWMDEFRRRMDSVFRDFETGYDLRSGGAWPKVNLYDAGAELVIRSEVPGLSDKDIEVSVNQNVLTLSGERKNVAPEGYVAHRQERAPIRFTRSFALPCKVDAEKASAQVKDGMLTIRLAKAPEAQPRQITVRAE